MPLEALGLLNAILSQPQGWNNKYTASNRFELYKLCTWKPHLLDSQIF